MAKKIRFKLEMPDGTHVGSIDELKEHFDLEAVIGYFRNGKLLTWLQDRYIEDEANALAELEETAPDFQRRLCAIFAVEYREDIDLEQLARRQERQAKLRNFTDEEEFLKNIDSVAFDQEELADLLDEECEKIYLCGDRFTIPASQKGKTYVGVNHPKVHIGGKAAESWEELGITVLNCDVENPPAHSAATVNKRSALDAQMVDLDMTPIDESVADKIYEELSSKESPFPGMRSTPDRAYVETKDYFVYERPSRNFFGSWLGDQEPGIYVISKKDGNSRYLIPEDDFPHPCCRNIESWISVENKLYAFFSEEPSEDAEVYILDPATGDITSLKFKVDPDHVCAANKQFFVASADLGKLTCVDLLNRKKYRLQHKDHDNNDRVCTKDALYFTDWNSRSLMKYTFEKHTESVVAKLPKLYGTKVMSYYNNQIFIMQGIGSDSYKIGSVNLASGQYKPLAPELESIIEDSIKKCDSGWLFVAIDDDDPIMYFDFQTGRPVKIATGCTSGEFRKIGQWIYYKLEDQAVTARVSINCPMEIERLGESF